MSEIVNSSSLMQEAIEQIIQRLVVDMGINFIGYVERVEIKKESSSVRSLCVSTDVYFKKWLFFKKKVLAHRYVLRLTYIYVPREFSAFNEGRLKCELFLKDSRLRNIVQPIVERLTEAPWFVHGVEYVDMSDSPLALYPGERQELPQARLLSG